MLRTAWLVAQLHIDLYRTSAPPIADRARRTGASDLWCIWWAVVPNCPLSPKEIADDRYGEYLNNGKAYAAGTPAGTEGRSSHPRGSDAVADCRRDHLRTSEGSAHPRHATLVTVQWWHRVGEEVAVTEEHQPKTNAEAQPHTGRPQHDKGLLNTSGWWLLLWVLVVILALWLAEQVGFFGA